MLVALAVAACQAPAEAPLSYARCSPGDVCGLGLRCESVGWRSLDASVPLCTLPCAADPDCPGVFSFCGLTVATSALDGGVGGRCLRSCEVDGDCRPGTTCQVIAQDGGPPKACLGGRGP